MIDNSSQSIDDRKPTKSMEEALKKKKKTTTLRIVESMRTRSKRNNNNNNKKKSIQFFSSFSRLFRLKKKKEKIKKKDRWLVDPVSKRNQACNGSIGSRIVSRWFHSACFERRFGVKERNRGGRVPKRYFLLHVDRVKWLRYRESSRIEEWRVGKTTLRRLQYHFKARSSNRGVVVRTKLASRIIDNLRNFLKDRSYSFTGGKMIELLPYFSEGGFNLMAILLQLDWNYFFFFF